MYVYIVMGSSLYIVIESLFYMSRICNKQLGLLHLRHISLCGCLFGVFCCAGALTRDSDLEMVYPAPTRGAEHMTPSRRGKREGSKDVVAK